MRLNTKSDQARSFCARRNHRDFLAISWNIWAICLRDEEPRGVSHWPNRPFLFPSFFCFPLPSPTAGISGDRPACWPPSDENREYFRATLVSEHRAHSSRNNSRIRETSLPGKEIGRAFAQFPVKLLSRGLMHCIYHRWKRADRKKEAESSRSRRELSISCLSRKIVTRAIDS